MDSTTNNQIDGIKHELAEPTKRKWKYFNYAVLFCVFMAPTLILIEWNVVLVINGWEYTNASVSRIIAFPDLLGLTLTVNFLSFIMLAIGIFARNIQIHVIFVNESFSLCWRYFNLLSLISVLIGYIGMIGMTIFDVHTAPFEHIIWAGIMIAGIAFYQIFHAILTLKHRNYIYKENKNDCKSAIYFIDGIYYIILSVNGLIWTVVYVVVYQTAGTNITDKGSGIDLPYYVYQWVGIWFFFLYPYMYIVTLYLDSTDNEMRLFFKYSYFYIVTGLCDLNYGEKINAAKDDTNQQL